MVKRLSSFIVEASYPEEAILVWARNRYLDLDYSLDKEHCNSYFTLKINGKHTNTVIYHQVLLTPIGGRLYKLEASEE